LAGRGIAGTAGCITIYGTPYRALVRCVGAALEFPPGRRVGGGRCVWARSAQGRIAQPPGALGKSAAQMSAPGRVRALARRPVLRRFGCGRGGGGLKIGSQIEPRSAPKIGSHFAPGTGAKRAQASRRAARQDADLQVTWRLRGFEPLTFSMRTQCSTGQTGQVTVSAQVRDLHMVTITASDVA
jgi:hypothetical protein